MIRVLTFEGSRATKRFELLRLALMSAGDGKGERTPAVIRKEARLQDLLEGISVPNGHNSDGQGPDRTLAEGGHELKIAQEDFELLSLYAERAQWTPRVARDAVDLWDWLSAAERRD